MKRILSIYVLLAAGLALAEPSIVVNRVQQRYPWNGLVDIDYTVAGMGDDALAYRVDITISATVDDVPTTYAARHFDGLSCLDLPTAEGAYRVTWDAAKDDASFQSSDVKVTAKLVHDPATAADADYVIVDLSAGYGVSATYPVRFVRGAAVPSSTFCSDTYRLDKLVFKRVAKGDFWMGSGNVSSGKNRHYVSLTNDFFLGVFEVTQRQYMRVMNKNPTSTKPKFRGETFPVCAGWNGLYGDSTSMCSNLCTKARFNGSAIGGFALPTESEWEYACRAGAETIYYWGSDSTDNATEYMWCSVNADGGFHPCGLKLPNDWGFYDMLGNVREFTRDYYSGTYPSGTPEEPAVDPRGPETGVQASVRGGARLDPATSCTCGIRSGGNLSGVGNNDYVGGRLSMEFYGPASGGAESETDSSSLDHLELDLRTSAVRSYAFAADVLPFVWTTSDTFARGGGSSEALVYVLPSTASDPADVSTWSDGAATNVVKTASSGEGIVAWMPEVRGLYRSYLSVGGALVASGAFDLRNASDLKDLIDLSTAEVTLSESTFRCDGYYKTPAVTVVFESKTLTEGADYVVRYANNVYAGTATVTVGGCGSYKGSKSVNFTITPPEATVYNASSLVAAAMDFTTNAVLTANLYDGVPPLAYNNATNWPAGGVATEGVTARISVAPMAGPDAEPGEFAELVNATGEGTYQWAHPALGYHCLKLEVCTDGVPSARPEDTLYRVIRIKAGGLMLFVR